MKKYEDPVMKAYLFDAETVEAQASAAPKTAVEEARSQAAELTGADNDKILTIVF